MFPRYCTCKKNKCLPSWIFVKIAKKLFLSIQTTFCDGDHLIKYWELNFHFRYGGHVGFLRKWLFLALSQHSDQSMSGRWDGTGREFPSRWTSNTYPGPGPVRLCLTVLVPVPVPLDSFPTVLVPVLVLLDSVPDFWSRCHNLYII